MAAKNVLLRRFQLNGFQGFSAAAPQGHRMWCSATSSSDEPNEKASHNVDDKDPEELLLLEQEIQRDIQPILMLTRDILHSSRYKDGERLTMEDERAVVENLLVYHPYSEDKFGCGLESIMVNRHPKFHWYSRCLFVVRTDGSWEDFSYKKCLQEYIRDKYNPNAERFIQARFSKNGYIRCLCKRWGI